MKKLPCSSVMDQGLTSSHESKYHPPGLFAVQTARADWLRCVTGSTGTEADLTHHPSLLRPQFHEYSYIYLYAISPHTTSQTRTRHATALTTNAHRDHRATTMGRTTSVIAHLALLVALVVSPAPGYGLYTEKGDVTLLRADTFEDTVIKDDTYWMVEFYAPWCGHCQQLAPEYEKAAKELKAGERAKLGAVDCDAEKELCGRDGRRPRQNDGLAVTRKTAMNA